MGLLLGLCKFCFSGKVRRWGGSCFGGVKFFKTGVSGGVYRFPVENVGCWGLQNVNGLELLIPRFSDRES